MFKFTSLVKTIVKQGRLIKDYDEENKILISENKEKEIIINNLSKKVEKIENENYKQKYTIKRYEKLINGLKKEFLESNNNNSLINTQNRLKTILGGIKDE